MMQREEIIKQVKGELDERRFSSVECKGCFDVATKGESTYLIKILSNADSFTESESNNLKAASYFLSAIPIIVSPKTRRGKIYDGVLHKRFGISALSLKSFLDFADGFYPCAMSSRSGLKINVDSDAISGAMKKKKVSLTEIASRLGVSRNTAHKFVNGGIISIDTAMKLETVLNGPVSKGFNVYSDDEYDILNPKSLFEKRILEHVNNTDIDFGFVHRSSFNFAVKGENTVLAKASDNMTIVKREIGMLANISDNLRMKPLIITEHSKHGEIDGVPVMDMNEFKKIESKREFYSFFR